jgi:hypothetical protein
VPDSIPPPLRSWLARVPDAVLAGALLLLLGFCWSAEKRLTVIETKLDAIGHRIGVDAGAQMATR